jgi:hypothetical protein
MAGYSKTPLLPKLGMKPGHKVWVVNAPDGYWEWLGPLPMGVRVEQTAGSDYDFIHFFSDRGAELTAAFPTLKASLAKHGLLWISWPKKAARLPTDLNENVIRDMGLANGLVDVKVAAINEVWSGLKFVYRLEDRIA